MLCSAYSCGEFIGIHAHMEIAHKQRRRGFLPPANAQCCFERALREVPARSNSTALRSGDYGNYGIMEKKMETNIVYWYYLGIMENKIETAIVFCHEERMTCPTPRTQPPQSRSRSRWFDTLLPSRKLT